LVEAKFKECFFDFIQQLYSVKDLKIDLLALKAFLCCFKASIAFLSM
jgi:hypothetical protein